MANPFSQASESSLFRTGDLAFFRNDGNLDLLGRLDDQVKIRGMRIEPGEIEAVLREQESISEAVVAVRSAGKGDKQLAAYVVGAGGKDPLPNQLRAALRLRLPEHMVPAVFVRLPSLPRTPSGKVDHMALSNAGQIMPERNTRVAPRTGTEIRLAAIWEALLGVEYVGVRDSFFDLGGHSLLAVRLFAAVEKAFGKRLPMTTILEGDTLEHVAQAIDEVVAPSIWPSTVPLQPGGSRPPFFCIHTINGDVVSYLGLASHVGSDQPFYAIRAQGLDGLQQPHTSIEAAAADYIREIRQIQPHGPYCLGASPAARPSPSRWPNSCTHRAMRSIYWQYSIPHRQDPAITRSEVDPSFRSGGSGYCGSASGAFCVETERKEWTRSGANGTTLL